MNKLCISEDLSWIKLVGDQMLYSCSIHQYNTQIFSCLSILSIFSYICRLWYQPYYFSCFVTRLVLLSSSFAGFLRLRVSYGMSASIYPDFNYIFYKLNILDVMMITIQFESKSVILLDKIVFCLTMGRAIFDLGLTSSQVILGLAGLIFLDIVFMSLKVETMILGTKFYLI